MPCGSASPACSAMLQQFFRGRSASTPRTNAQPGGGSPPGRTGPPSDRATCRSRPPNRQPLRCGPRPPPDLQMSTQRTRIARWPCHVRDRHAARSRPTTGVLGWCAWQCWANSRSTASRWPGPVIRMWSRHPLRRVPMKHLAIAVARSARIGVRMVWGSRSRPEFVTCGDRRQPTVRHDHGRFTSPAPPDLRPAPPLAGPARPHNLVQRHQAASAAPRRSGGSERPSRPEPGQPPLPLRSLGTSVEEQGRYVHYDAGRERLGQVQTAYAS